ncbi:hypothetical protein PAECIP112173_02610 [Paenibacillus sp. JJ-100]|uniref:DUF4097 family beta strand repeat-containing protein n=1 Tax=Paenibacillus sp. JJ-100 TaxID=2974896 RepID=UPI0022FFC0A9|nr:DUF4097 family beta strand repeat-containing protein [Paenibacillus sp. JJ-100]CAI6079080.1 hypothetical protein PAECIP112173_02610 [Paenibacillus sp. JJ-100]
MLKSSELRLCKTLDVDQSIDDIDVDWLSGDIHVRLSEDEFIHVIQYADKRYSERKLMQYRINGNQLSIVDGRKKGGFIGFNIGRTALEIQVPHRIMNSILVKMTGGQLGLKGIRANRCQCKVTSGSLAMSGTMEKLEVYATASDIYADQIKANRFVLHSSSSKIEITGEFQHVESKATGRTLLMECLQTPNSFHSISTGMKAVVRIPDREGFEVQLNERSGSLKSDFELTPLQSEHKRFSYNNGEKQFYIDIRGGSFHLKRRS